MASVFLGDLNDFITPSQSCVNPLFVSTKNKNDNSDVGAVSIAIELEDEIETFVPYKEPDLIKSSASKTATVSLNDCLACSGCVTSAETVLIAEQSAHRLLKALNDNEHSLFVASLSPQSRSSLSDYFGCSLTDAEKKVAGFLKSIGFHYVLDASCGGDLCLLATREEFISRSRALSTVAMQDSAMKSSKRFWEAPLHTTPVSKFTYREVATGKEISADPAKQSMPILPLLVSSCPGFVCYVEKIAPEAIAYMSHSKSPQAMIGGLIKGPLACFWNTSSASIFHVSIQPCFDRKLEASRLDFYDPYAQCKDVDLVLSTNELLDMMNQHASVQNSKVESFLSSDIDSLSMFQNFEDSKRASTYSTRDPSGGYAEYIFRYAASELHGICIDNEKPLDYKIGRNPDLREVSLEKEGKTVMRFAIAYGFRNIQSILMQLKNGRSQYDFVEVMACPGGCVNGGGQIKPEYEVPQQMRARIERVGMLMKDAEALESPDDNILLRNMTAQALHADIGLYTSFHSIQKLEESNAMFSNW